METANNIRCKCGECYSVLDSIVNLTDHFVITQCPSCSARTNKCLHCPSAFHNNFRKNDLRSIRNHVKTKHPGVEGCFPVRLQEPASIATSSVDHPCSTDELSIPNSDYCNPDDALEEVNEFSNQSADWYVDPTTPPELITESNNTDATATEIAQPQWQSSIESFNFFSNHKTNAYFWQEHMCHLERCGGLRGSVWRSVFKRKLYDKSKLSSISDTRLLFNMTEQALNNTEE